MAEYGLFRGLNEAYDAYRGRERSIEEENRRAWEDENRQRLAEQQQEQYEYGVSRRGVQERAEEAALEGAELGLQKARQETKEFLDPTAIAQREQAALDQADLTKMQLEEAGMRIDDAKITLKLKERRAKYQEWTEKWQTGQWDVDDLKAAFNGDDDKSNDITGVFELPGGGWEVQFRSGNKIPFRDRRAVTQHLQEMANPAFLENMLLNEMKEKYALKVEMAKLGQTTTDEMNKRGQAWVDDAKAEIQATYGKIFPNGLVDFGEDGDRELAQQVRAMTNHIGRVYGYDLSKTTPSEIAVQIGIIAERELDTNPEKRRMRAQEEFELMPDSFFTDPNKFPDGRPDEGDPEYDAVMRQLMMEQAKQDMEALKTEVYAHFLRVDKDGNPIPREKTGGGGEAETTARSKEGLDEPIEEDVAADTKQPATVVERPAGQYAEERTVAIPPSVDDPMNISEFMFRSVTGITQQGSAFADEAPAEYKAKLSQKKRRKLEQTAKRAMDAQFPELNGQQKVSWLNHYGPVLSKKDFEAALKKVPKYLKAAVKQPGQKGLTVAERPH